MSLSRQLYIIIALIFFMIFAGNFLISIKNTKEYLETESISKAQDTATTLGFSLKNLIKDKDNPEIEATINAVSNSGFYKELRLEDALFTISESKIIEASKLDKSKLWKIKELKIDENIGTLEVSTQSDDFEKELLSLQGIVPNQNNQNIVPSEDIYTFIPKQYLATINLKLDFKAINQFEDIVNGSVNLELNKILVQVKRDVKFDSVPQWFIDFIPINLGEQYTEISDGWKTSAVLFVSANAGEAYNKLYSQAQSAVIYAFIMFIVSIFIVFIFVQYLLKPLNNLERLAYSISEGRFSKINPLPKTKELNAVSIAFNDMSDKIEATITRLNTNVENMSKKLSFDELTSLSLRQTFETDMKQMFIEKSKAYIFVVKMYDLANFAKSHTSSETNDFIKNFSNVLSNTKYQEKGIKYYRFYGSEFAIIAKDFSFEDAKGFAKLLKNRLDEFAKELNVKDIAHIGATPFNTLGTTVSILQSANQAYEKATLIGQNEFNIIDENEIVKDMESWKQLVFDIIENSLFEVRYIGNFAKCNSEEVIMQEAFTSIKDKSGDDIAIGTFVSIAEKYKKIVDFDKKVIEKVINYIEINSIKHDIAINLSLDSVNDTAFIAWLEKKLEKHKNIVSQLVFSVTAYAVARNIDKFRFFIDEVHRFGAKVIVKRYETRFISLSDIKELNLDYLRLARDYTCDICIDFSKQSLIESIAEISNLLNIKVLAENVQKDEDYKYLKDVNLYALSR